MYWQDEDILYQKINELKDITPASCKESKERLHAVLVMKAKKMDQRANFFDRFSLVLQVSIFFLITAGGVSLAIQIPVHESEPTSHEQPSYAVQEQPSAQEASPSKSIQKSIGEVDQKRIAGTTVPQVSLIRPSKTEVQTDNPSHIAIDNAVSYLQQMIGEESRKYQIMESLSDAKQHKYIFTRMVNGIPLLDDYYVVTLDEKNNGTNLYSRKQNRVLNEQLFSDPANVISRKEAETIIANKMKLVYTSRTDINKAASTREIVYMPELMGYVNAQDGQMIGFQQNQNDLSGMTVRVESKGRSLFANTKGEAAAFLQAELDIAVDGAPRISGGSDVKEYRWKTGNNSAIAVQTKEETGQVIGVEYVKYPSSHPATTTKATAEMVKMAASFLQNYLNPQIIELQVTKVESHESVIRLYFHEVYEGIPLIDTAYFVDVDPISEKVVGFHGDFATEKVELKDREKKTSTEKMAREYLRIHPATLAYIWPDGTEAPSLVYMPLDRQLFDY